jgi:hypothetical protein
MRGEILTQQLLMYEPQNIQETEASCAYTFIRIFAL